jgi:NAD(P)H-dependent FMN reductase
MTSNDGRIRIAVLCGSVRPGNYTRMAADVVVASLSADPDVSVDVVDPSARPPPGGTGKRRPIPSQSFKR